LNWLLDKISTASLAYEAVYGSDDTYIDSDIDMLLQAKEIHHIVLNDGGGEYGEKLNFRADDAKVLTQNWPAVFRDADFEPYRTRLEAAIGNGLKEIHGCGELSYQTWMEMRDAVAKTEAFLEQKYPKSRRLNAPATEWLLYHRGKCFLKLEELAILRAMNTNQMEAFDGSNAFMGDSVFELIRHLCRNGLDFSPPEPGDEPTYEKLLIAMRHIYLHFYPDELAHWK
jgi:hypothetical protein